MDKQIIEPAEEKKSENVANKVELQDGQGPLKRQEKREMIEGGQQSLEPGGLDKRVLVQDLQRYPYSNICYIRSTSMVGSLSGTGCLIGKKTVLTCAHNCYKKMKTQNFQFDCEVNINGKVYKSKSYYSDKYKQAALDSQDDFLYDIAILELQTEVEDSVALPLDFSGQEIKRLTKMQCMIAGFPGSIVPPGTKVQYYRQNGSKIYKLKNTVQNKPPKMYQHTEQFDCESIGPNGIKIKHKVDTTQGQSGSPILINTENGDVCIGVHIQGYINLTSLMQKINKGEIPAQSQLDNYGVGLSDHNYQFVKEWYLKSEKVNLNREPKFD